jgi:hypothetical protein
MRARCRLLTVLAALSLPPPAVPAEQFLELGGCPPGFTGRPGEVLTLQLPVTLSTPGLTGLQGVRGWSVTVAVFGGELGADALKSMFFMLLGRELAAELRST